MPATTASGAIRQPFASRRPNEEARNSILGFDEFHIVFLGNFQCVFCQAFHCCWCYWFLSPPCVFSIPRRRRRESGGEEDRARSSEHGRGKERACASGSGN